MWGDINLSDEEWINKNKDIHELLSKKAEQAYNERKRAEERKRKEELMSLVNKDIKFITKFVRKGQSRQDGSKHVFYDVMIDEKTLPKIVVHDPKKYRNIEKWNKIRGRSLNLSYYAAWEQYLEESIYVNEIYIPAIQKAYDDFVYENLRGKEIEYNGEKCKAWTIDWFDEVFIADKKIPISFDIWLNQFKEKHKTNFNYPKEYELTDREKAWADYANLGMSEFFKECLRIKDMENPNEYFDNANDYLDEAQKILHRKF